MIFFFRSINSRISFNDLWRWLVSSLSWPRPLVVTHPSHWFQSGPFAVLQVLLSGSLPASDPQAAGMRRIFFYVPRHQNCATVAVPWFILLLLQPFFQPSHINKRRWSQSGFCILCLHHTLSCLFSCFGTALLSGVWNCEDFAFCPHLNVNGEWLKDWAAEGKHLISLSNHKFGAGQISECSKAEFIYRLQHWGVCVFSQSGWTWCEE